jgi:adenylate kinase
MTHFIITGRPGSGKGTQAKLLAETFNIPHISTGDIFRDHMKRGTELGVQITDSMNAGKYTSDDITNQVIAERLQEDDVVDGFILDGYPRTLAQAQFLDTLPVKIDKLINLEVSEQDCVDRLVKRAETSGRGDDEESVIKERMKTYSETVIPVVDFYRSKDIVFEVDGSGSQEQIHAQLVAGLAE